MRLRLISSFIFIVLVAVASVVLIASQNTASEVRAFMFRGGMTGTEGFVVALEEYYQTNQTWQGVFSQKAGWDSPVRTKPLY